MIYKLESKYRIELILFIITILALILRVYHIDFNSHWLDELFSAWVSNPNHSIYEAYVYTVTDVHPPFYQLLLWVWYKIFGYNEVSGRMLSAAVGVLLIPAIYLLGKELFSRESGLIAAGLATINFFLIKYSQETRSYELLSLLTVLSFLFFARLLKEQNKDNLALYSISSALLANTHYFGFFPLLAQAVIYLQYIFKDGFNKKLFYYGSISGVIVLISISHLFGILIDLANRTSTWIKPPKPDFLGTYFSGYYGANHLVIIFSVLLLYSLFIFYYKKQNVRSFHILLIWISVSLLVPYLKSIVSTPLLHIKNTIIIVPALILLAAYAISEIRDHFTKQLTVVLIVILSFSVLAFEKKYYTKHHKQEWRQVVTELIRQKDNYPLYAVRDKYFNAYFGMLESDLRVENINKLGKDINNQSLPEYIWVLDAHNMAIAGMNIEGKYGLKEIQRIERKGVVAIKYRRGSGGTAKNGYLPFDLFTFSKPFPKGKEGEIVMPWNGDIYLPDYKLVSGTYLLRIEHKGKMAKGKNAEFIVKIIDNATGSVVYSHDYYSKENYSMENILISISTSGSYRIQISFVNDYYDKENNVSRDAYIKSIFLLPFNKKSDGTIMNNEGNSIIGDKIAIATIIVNSNKFNYSLDGNDENKVCSKDNKQNDVACKLFGPTPKRGSLRNYKWEFEKSIKIGAVTIKPVRGDNKYPVGHIALL